MAGQSTRAGAFVQLELFSIMFVRLELFSIAFVQLVFFSIAFVQLELFRVILNMSGSRSILLQHIKSWVTRVHAWHLPWVLLHYLVNFVTAQLSSQLFHLKDDVISFLPSYR